MMTRLDGSAGHSNGKFGCPAIMVIVCTLFVLTGYMSMPDREAYAFWTALKPGGQAQHEQITSLIRWPGNDLLFDTYRDKLGKWSEDPDRGKDPVVGHGIALFDKMNEESRGRLSFSKAVEHYQNYLKNPRKTEELEIAAQCLAHSYHYLADVGDYTEGREGFREETSKVLNDKRFLNDAGRLIDTNKNSIPPDLDKIIGRLKLIKMCTSDTLFIRNGIAVIVACLEQVNVCFLTQVKSTQKQK